MQKKQGNKYETIEGHSRLVVQAAEEILNLYQGKISKKVGEENFETFRSLLFDAAKYHDIGKQNKKFQDKLQFGKRSATEAPHAFLSAALLPMEELTQKYTKGELFQLINAIIHHHSRDFSPLKSLADRRLLALELSALKQFLKIQKAPNFPFPYYKENAMTDKEIAEICTKQNLIFEDFKKEYILLKGLLNKSDYSASAHIPAELPTQDLSKKIEAFFKEKSFPPNALQKELADPSLKDKNIICQAQTGMGKTEAALHWVSGDKLFYTLPITTAIDSMFSRLKETLFQNKIENQLGILHHNNTQEYFEIENVDPLDEQNKAKLLSLPFTISTIDQLFPFVFKHKGYEHKLATLSYSKTVIDEIQMYDVRLIAILLYALKEINKMGGKFAIMTATLPPFIADTLKELGVPFEMTKPYYKTFNRHFVKIENEIDTDAIISSFLNGKKVLVICNTVKKAQSIYREIKLKIEKHEEKNRRLSSKNIRLFHSRYIQKDKKMLQNQIFEDSKKEGPCIWITTQIAESSLDIDFDELHTELSELCSLFQRMGRAYRNREYNKNTPNVFVYTENVSGVGKVVDSELFLMSKNILSNYFGIMPEEKKTHLINQLYNIKNLSGTNFYKKFFEQIKYLEKISVNQMSKKEAARKIREIQNVNIIPYSVYLENKIEIDLVLSKAENKTNKGFKMAKQAIRNYSVNVPFWMIDEKYKTGEIQIGKEKFEIYDFLYSSDLGLEKPIKENEKAA